MFSEQWSSSDCEDDRAEFRLFLLVTAQYFRILPNHADLIINLGSKIDARDLMVSPLNVSTERGGIAHGTRPFQV